MRMLASAILIPILAQQRQPVQIPDTGPRDVHLPHQPGDRRRDRQRQNRKAHRGIETIRLRGVRRRKAAEGLGLRISETRKPIRNLRRQLTLADQLKLPEAPKTTITTHAPGEIQYHDKRLLVFYFDFSSMGIPEQIRAQDAATEYLEQADHQGRSGGDSALHQHRPGPDRFHGRPRRALRHHPRLAHRRNERTGRPGRHRRR